MLELCFSSITEVIVEIRAVAKAMAKCILDKGGNLLVGAKVTAIENGRGGLRLLTTKGAVETKWVINCGGLYSDRIARMMGIDPQVRIVPFRGEFYKIRPEKRHLVNNLLYPVPNPQLPFLGVHFTPTLDGGL